MQPVLGTNHVKNVTHQVKHVPEPHAHEGSPFEAVPPPRKPKATKPAKKKGKK